MQIFGVNKDNQCFTAQAKTKKNNTYDKTNMGKLLGSGIGIGYITERLTKKGGYKEFKNNFSTEISKAISKETSTHVSKFKTPYFKNLAALNATTHLVISMACCFGVGALFDKLLNAHRRDKADGKLI